MNKPEAASFSAPELAEAFDRVAGAAANLGSKLDLISNDIKTLEAKLADLGVTQPTHVKFGNITELVGTTQMTWDERVLWDKGENGRFRLFYECWSTDDCDPTDEGGGRGSLTPLIETKREVRIRAHRVLPTLVLKLGATIDPDVGPEAPANGEANRGRQS